MAIVVGVSVSPWLPNILTTNPVKYKQPSLLYLEYMYTCCYNMLHIVLDNSTVSMHMYVQSCDYMYSIHACILWWLLSPIGLETCLHELF